MGGLGVFAARQRKKTPKPGPIILKKIQILLKKECGVKAFRLSLEAQLEDFRLVST